MSYNLRTQELADSAGAVFRCAEAFALSQALTPRQKRAFETAFSGLRETLARGDTPYAVFIHLPLLVYEAASGRPWIEAVPLAAATATLFLGIDIFDDIADGDLTDRWRDHGPGEADLTAAALIGPLPHLLISGLDTPVERRAFMAETMARGLLEMSAGQHDDLAFRSAEGINASDVEASVVKKSGGEGAMFARLAAQFAGASEPVVDCYEEMGRALGTAGQISSDLYDIFEDAHSRDLANGTRTLPIVRYIEGLQGAESVSFLELLDLARHDSSAQGTIRDTLKKAGMLRRCALVVEIYLSQARALLEKAKPAEPAAGVLRELIDHMSILGMARRR